MRKALTHARLVELLIYDQQTGIFTRRVAVGLRLGQRAGDIVGTRTRGYLACRIDGVPYLLHRLAWFYVYRVWPNPECDHKDTVRHHNWITNLRPATKAQNMHNQRRAHRGNTSGYLGVSWDRARSKWKAQIKVDGRNQHIGHFSIPAEASDAYWAKKRELHPTINS